MSLWRVDGNSNRASVLLVDKEAISSTLVMKFAAACIKFGYITSDLVEFVYRFIGDLVCRWQFKPIPLPTGGKANAILSF